MQLYHAFSQESLVALVDVIQARSISLTQAKEEWPLQRLNRLMEILKGVLTYPNSTDYRPDIDGLTSIQANAKIEYLTGKHSHSFVMLSVFQIFQDHHHMCQDETALHTHDLDNLTKCNQQLYDYHVEQLRNENANLRAEKKIWESVQVRLVQENKTLSVERSHLADLMANVQRMHSDLERLGENDRQHLENQIQMMDDQTKDVKAQLLQERNAVRHITLQKDIDLKDLQTCLDKTTEQLSQARESLIGTETSKVHLQERVDQLTRQLQGNEEKPTMYKHRPSVANGAAPTEQDLPREQQLKQEVVELRSALKVAQVDLAAARSHMQQFQEISQANEAALSALNATHDQYKTETEAQISKNELEYKALQNKLRSLEHLVWTNDKKTLEDTIVDLSTSERTSETDRTTRENEVRQQEERALAAEDRYSREVVVHVESIKTIETLKQQLSVSQATSRENLSEAANAQTKLAASEGSWRQQKEALDTEIADLNTHSKDLSAQNALLHQHLETVSTQATCICQAADSSATEGTAGDADVGSNVDTKVPELRSVVAYLRKEKEIVDLQLELSKQENRPDQPLLRRERAMEAATSDAQHTEMLERINQFNILQESNATLHTDCKTYAKHSRELDAKLQALSAELEPTKEQAHITQAELQARDAQIMHLEGESHRWQEHNTQLLSKYDCTNPTEIQALKDEIETLKTQKADMEKLAAEHEERANTIQAWVHIFFSDDNAVLTSLKLSRLEANFRIHKDSNMKSVDKFKSSLGLLNSEKSQLNATVSELEGKIKTLTAERDALRTTTVPDPSQQLNSQLERLRQEKATLEQVLCNERAAKA
ncbi:TPR/MLP1/MLP2-like protein-domain-containing protein [Suillus lakei]|nr:TPR/MLP1/MLP2-like protein-domain-containing protein [Suillus lakei]